MLFDVVVGLQHGDEGKGKVVKQLVKNYTHCLRFNGGPNAGHTVYLENKRKIHLRQIPVGIFEDVICILGPGCLVNTKVLETEINMLKKLKGDNIISKIKICKNVHIISNDAIEMDKNNNVVGSTGNGIAQTYSYKCLRENKRICDTYTNDIFGCEIIDLYTFFNSFDCNYSVLCEGAQGFELDLDLGDYPFVTSSNCTTGQLICNGVPYNKINIVYGISKIYDTYVGSKTFQPEDDIKLNELQILGNEFGTVTERKRQCNWLNLTKLKKATICNGVKHLIINKCDIIEKLDYFCLYIGDEKINFSTFEDMKSFIVVYMSSLSVTITFSYSPYFI